MAVKLYTLVWVLGFLAVAVTYMAGYFTPIVAITFGFLSFGAVFMGMIGVLPITATHRDSAHH
jgi:hypothetical protein